ncbi:acetylglutamate kinase [Pseudoramibacter faecis]|uniref:acetylglutamate kinase n=1 Tax=Pseudoramibacter faecis TaxID=3108534 RepID=UPI002E77B8E1|nr:acetylglutamate kinase [Pseudoramibacter sp. HA2172]
MIENMSQYIEKANTLIEALPYIREFSDKTVVIKYGGSFMDDQDIKYSVMDDIALMKLVGIRPIVVHGGGKDISSMLDQLDIQSEFMDGLRVTSKETVSVAEMVLCGKINKEIVQLLQNRDINAVGISGKDGGMLRVKKKLSHGKDIGYVGEITRIKDAILQDMLRNDYVPVIAPIGYDRNKQTYNINADHVAYAIAKKLKAEKLIYLTDTEGVYMDHDDPNSIIGRLGTHEVYDLISQRVISGGMIPKVENAVNAIEGGVKSVHILDGRIEHSILLELFTAAGCGTMIKDDFPKYDKE